jgi:hypothetical protein
MYIQTDILRLKIILSEEVFQRCRKIASGICKTKKLNGAKKSENLFIDSSEFKLLKQDNELLNYPLKKKKLEIVANKLQFTKG